MYLRCARTISREQDEQDGVEERPPALEEVLADEAVVHAVGFILLIGLMLIITFKDIWSLIVR